MYMEVMLMSHTLLNEQTISKTRFVGNAVQSSGEKVSQVMISNDSKEELSVAMQTVIIQTCIVGTYLQLQIG